MAASEWKDTMVGGWAVTMMVEAWIGLLSPLRFLALACLYCVVWDRALGVPRYLPWGRVEGAEDVALTDGGRDSKDLEERYTRNSTAQDLSRHTGDDDDDETTSLRSSRHSHTCTA